MKKMISICWVIASLMLSACSESGILGPGPAAEFTHYQVHIPDSAARAAFALPLDIEPALSANFAELRPNHFHNGLDFKTQGVTGKKVMSVADGYVSRISVSPYGYGRALFVTHPDMGLTSIYAHLDSFNDTIASIVADRQAKEGGYEVDITLDAGDVPVRQGDEIALSGNSGGSFGPHLHFAISDADGKVFFDPLDFYADHIKDTTSPVVRAVSLIAIEGEGVVDDGMMSTRKSADGDAMVFEAHGKVVPAIDVCDRMDNVNNIYGVKWLTLEVNDSVVFQYDAKYIEAENTRAINTLIHYPTLIYDDVYAIYTNPPVSSPLKPMLRGNGTIDVVAGRNYKCRFVAGDHHGNITTVPFEIKGVETAIIPAPERTGKKIEWGRGGKIEADAFRLEVPELALYADYDIEVVVDSTLTRYSRTYTVGDERVTLASPVTMSIDLINDTISPKNRYCIVDVDYEGRERYHGGEYADGRITADVNRFGTFTVSVDSVAPVIKPIGKDKWKSKGEVRLKGTDDLSGIVKYTAQIDGQFRPLEYDAKNDLFICPIDYDRLPEQNKHTIKIILTDACGNTTIEEFKF